MTNASIIFLVIITTFCGPVFAQEKADRTDPYVISRINDPVTLDGMSDEPAWEGIDPLPLYQLRPQHGEPPSERSEFMMGYDDNYFYVSGRMYDSEPDKIDTSSMARDFWGYGSDNFSIVIDSFNNNENSVMFLTTPTGTRTDVEFTDDAEGAPYRNTNTSWNTVWDVATSITDDGWFVEIRIPFSSLKFQEENGEVVMGIIASRWINRKSESLSYPLIPQELGNWGKMKASQARDIVFEDIHGHKPLYVTPYVLGGIGQKNDLNDAGIKYERTDETEQDAGLDIKYGLTDNLTLDVTVNTDFAQVEADNQQINLTRFSLFFPEKRLFFQERSGTFEFRFEEFNRLFYSRRIGLHNDNQVRIYGGARIVGKSGPWEIGFLDMQTEKFMELPSENFGVLRLRRQVFNPDSYVGGIVTTRIGTDDTWNTAYGFDGIIRMTGNDYLSVKWAQTFDESCENEVVSLDPSRLYIDWERRQIDRLHYKLYVSRAGSDYIPGIGYERRTDFTRFGDSIQYGWMPGGESRIYNHRIFVEGFTNVRNGDSSLESSEIGPGWRFDTKALASGSMSLKQHREDVRTSFSFSDDTGVPVGKYTYYEFVGEYCTTQAKMYWVTIILSAGSFYDGRRGSLNISPVMNISKHVFMNGTYEINRLEFPDRDQRFTGHIARLLARIMPSIRHTCTAFIQYNSANDLILSNFRYRFNPREGHDLYIVYDEGFNTDRHREIPTLPITKNRTVMVKYNYMFNL